ncbi:MAG: mechanosensitive ion channel family protein [Alphaproteobacteria bacterium]|jgi:small-conductance mechanosensitive channel|nr:mechanosensitive ion channel family protein [Alphaproteobacteria bacterium]
MKKYFKFFITLLITLFLYNSAFAAEQPTATSLNDKDKEVLADFLNILKDPNKVQSLINTLENTTGPNTSTNNVPVATDTAEKSAPEEYPEENIADHMENFISLANEQYQQLGLYEKSKQYIKDFEADLININYKNLAILVLAVALANIILLLIEYFYAKAYNVQKYVRDFTKHYKRNSFIKGNFLLFLINLRFFLPTILPVTLLMTVGKVSTNVTMYEWVLNLFVFTVILMLLLRFLKIIFFKVQGTSLYKLKNWIFSFLWVVFSFLGLHYVFTEMKDFALAKLNIAIFVIVMIVFAINLRILIKKINHRLSNHARKYERFLLHAKKYSITLLYIAVYSYLLTILFLDSGIIKDAIIKTLFVIIGMLCIYLVQSLLYSVFIEKTVIRRSDVSANISQLLFNNTTSKSGIDLTLFWRIFNVFYYIVFALMYIYLFDKIIETNLISKLDSLIPSRVSNIIVNIFFAFGFLLVLTFIAIIYIEKYLSKLAKEGDVAQLKKTLTLYKIMQKPYKIVFCIVLGITVVFSLGIPLGILLSSTGVITMLVAFGMKDILQNFFNSIMFFLENSFSLNDSVDLGGAKGTVEEISMVYIKIRDSDGSLINIPFKNINNIINYSKDYSFAIIEVGVAYNSDLDKVFKILVNISEELKQDEKVGKAILAPLETIGVVSFSDGSVNVRCRIKVAVGKQTSVKTMFLRKIHDTFAKESIEIPFPQRLYYLKNEN